MTAPITATLSIDFDPALVDEVAWSAQLTDAAGQSLATFEGPSVHDVLLAAAVEVDRFVAGARCPVAAQRPADAGECGLLRERAVAGVSDSIAPCPVHDVAVPA